MFINSISKNIHLSMKLLVVFFSILFSTNSIKNEVVKNVSPINWINLSNYLGSNSDLTLISIKNKSTGELVYLNASNSASLPFPTFFANPYSANFDFVFMSDAQSCCNKFDLEFNGSVIAWQESTDLVGDGKLYYFNDIPLFFPREGGTVTLALRPL